MPVTIHGKQYITVAERIAKANGDIKSINTEVLFIEPRVVIKATVETKKGIFTGISAANASKTIEKESPFEVAETSAVGRALAFAGYEVEGGIASAEEVVKAIESEESHGVCPKDGGKLLEKETKAGKKFLKCENGGYDVEKRVATGCDYVDWMNPSFPVTDKKNPYAVKEEIVPIDEYEASMNKTGHDFDEDFSTIH